MEIIIDTSIYAEQTAGGISRIYNEIIPRLCNYEEAEITLVTTKALIQPLPYHSKLHFLNISAADNFLRPRRYFRKIYELAANFTLNNGIGKIWHSTYYYSYQNWEGNKIVTVYDMIYEQYPHYFQNPLDYKFREQKKKVILGANRIISISKTTTEILKNIYPSVSGQILTIPLACSDLFRPFVFDSIPEEKKIKEPFILYIGRRSLYKNFNELLQTYSMWDKKHEVHLVIVGPELEDYEKKYFHQLGVGKNIIYYSKVDDSTLCYLYNQALAFVYPSLFEGFGIPILEAMASGCPIIASPIPSTIEIAGSIPYYYEFDNNESLIYALEQAIKEGKESRRVREGLAHVKQYSWDQTANETFMVYKSLI